MNSLDKPLLQLVLLKNRTEAIGAGTLLCLVSFVLYFVFFGTIAASAFAQDQASQGDQAVAAHTITKSVHAVGYQVGAGGTKVDLRGTELMPDARGEVKVEIKSRASTATLEVKVNRLKPPSTLGAEFITYVVWVVTPEGRTGNTGELLIDKDGEGKLKATTPAQTFSLIVTAEPYFAVRLPSDMVVLQSEMRKDTKGKIFPVSEYRLMKRDQYQKLGNPLALTLDPHVPLEMYEARNAVEVAKSRGADKYAPEIFAKAEASLKMSETALSSKGNKNSVMSTARQTVQFAEDARALSMQRQEAERIAQEKAAAAAKARAEAEAKAAAEAVEARRIADANAAEAKQKADAEMAETRRKAEAEIAAREAARKLAEAQKHAAEREKRQLRARMLEQFNRVLPTTDTDRGLVVNMGDVLFDTGKSDLRSEAREALARLSGIVLNYPSLHLAIEGHTDSMGSADFNQTLSEKRSGSVRDYLVSQGVDAGTLTVHGFGMDRPVADNKTAEGRQRNRRVEVVVSGEVIGVKIGAGE